MENIRTLSYAYINFYIEHPTYYSFMYRNTYKNRIYNGTMSGNHAWKKNLTKGDFEMKQIILTGDRPTGRLHVGHYVGSLKERVR